MTEPANIPSPPPAYDFDKGDMRVAVDGKTVAIFPRRYFPNMILDMVTELKDDLKREAKP